MKKGKRNILVAGLALCALTQALANGSSDAAPVSSKTAEKPASIKLMMDGTWQVKENGEQALIDGYKKLTGIDIVLNHPIHNEYQQKVDLAFSTGDVPDVLILSNNALLKYASNGALVDLTALYDNSDFKKRVKDPSVVEALRINGKLYAIPGERGNGTITYVRGDWLEKLGMKAPTNYKEFIEMLRAFKNKNPDGLPPEKVIPITAPGLVNTEYPLDIYLREFYQDATPDFVNKNGKWVDGMSEPNMEGALQRMKDAYAEGLIDTEIITNKTSTCRDKFYSGNVGTFNYWAGTWNKNLYDNISKTVPGSKVTPIPAIKETKYIERPATAFAITKACKNPAGVFKYFIELMHDGAAGTTLAAFGTEGIYYKVENGKIVFLPSIQNPKNNFTKGWTSPELPLVNWTPNWTPDPLITNSLAMFQSNCVAYKLLPASDVLNELQPELNATRTKYVTQIVYGKIGIKEGLAAYKAETAKAVDAILQDVNKKK